MLDEFELDGKTGRTIRKVVEKAREKDSARAADRLTVRDGGRLRFDARPPELVPLAELSSAQGYDAAQLSHALRDLLEAYFESLPRDRRALLGRYRLQDAARKVVGVGSVGRRAWVALLTGRDEDDPLVLQVKEAEESVVERYWRPSGLASHGERVVEGQRLVQSTSDFLLGWTSVPTAGGGTRDYYARQLWNGKGSIDLAAVGPESLENVAQLCAWSLAHAHAAPATRLPSRPTSTTATPSRTPCGTSPAPTPTRTRPTTRRSLSELTRSCLLYVLAQHGNTLLRETHERGDVTQGETLLAKAADYLSSEA